MKRTVCLLVIICLYIIGKNTCASAQIVLDSLHQTEFNYSRNDKVKFSGFLRNDDTIVFVPLGHDSSKNNVDDCIKMKYYAYEHRDVIYEKLRKGIKISNAYIDFSILIDDSTLCNEQNRVVAKFNFNECRIRSIERKETSAPPIYGNLYSALSPIQVQDTFRINNCMIGQIDLQAVEFLSPFRLNNTWCYNHGTIFNSIFYDDFYFSNTTFQVDYPQNYGSSALRIENCDFQKYTWISTILGNPLYIKNCRFIKLEIWSQPLHEQLTDLSARIVGWRNAPVFEAIRCDSGLRIGGSIKELQFRSFVFLGGSFIMHPSVFADTWPTQSPPSIIQELYFVGESIVQVMDTIGLVGIGFKPKMIQRIIPIYIMSGRVLDGSEFEIEILNAQKQTEWSSQDRDETIQRFEFFRDEQHRKVLGELQLSVWGSAEYYWLEIKYLVVNHGYHGLASFAMSLFIIVVFYSIVFMWRRRYVIVTYVNTQEVTPYGFSPVTYRTGNWIQKALGSFVHLLTDFLRCTWFSFVVLVNPRWPAKYFKFPQGLILLVFSEWLIGIFLLCLFIVYILAKYPFVKAFLAL